MSKVQNDQASEVALETIITNAIKVPGVKVNRAAFLHAAFEKENVDTQQVIDLGPIQAGCSREEIERIAGKLILTRVGQSSAASFAMGIPGGLAMGATIPADALQFFGMALRLAQELAYLYGAGDMFQDGQVDDEAVRGQLILYCGVMFGVSGATAGVRYITTQIARTTLKKLPQKALTKTVWYPIVKQIGKLIGVKVTKNTVAKGVSKAVPVVGGVISGGLNFASMLPMAQRLATALDKASFDYSEAEMIADYQELQSLAEDVDSIAIEEKDPLKVRAAKGVKDLGQGLSGLLPKGKKTAAAHAAPAQPAEDAFSKLEKLSRLKDMGAISQEEFEAKKAQLLEQI